MEAAQTQLKLFEKYEIQLDAEVLIREQKDSRIKLSDLGRKISEEGFTDLNKTCLGDIQWYRNKRKTKLRELHLAANFIRRTPYWKVESNVRQLMNGYFVFKILDNYFPGKYTRDEVDAWINNEN